MKVINNKISTSELECIRALISDGELRSMEASFREVNPGAFIEGRFFDEVIRVDDNEMHRIVSENLVRSHWTHVRFRESVEAVLAKFAEHVSAVRAAGHDAGRVRAVTQENAEKVAYVALRLMHERCMATMA